VGEGTIRGGGEIERAEETRAGGAIATGGRTDGGPVRERNESGIEQTRGVRRGTKGHWKKK